MAKYRRGSEQWWRTEYSKVSSRIRSQIRKLEQRYPESVALERGGVEDWQGLRDLPKDYGLKELKRLTKYAKQTLKSGLYSLRTSKRSRAQASRTLSDIGIKVSQENLRGYFQFLDDLRARGIGSMKGSDWWARMYNRAMKQGMSNDELRKNIEYWAQKFEQKESYVPRLVKSSSAALAD